MISRVPGKWTMYLFSASHGHGTSGRVVPSARTSGYPTECTQGTKSPSAPSWSRAGWPMRVMIRMFTAT
jgi:hypothetical protein